MAEQPCIPATNDFSWLDKPVEELKSLQPSVLDDVSTTIQAFNARTTNQLEESYIQAVVRELTYTYFLMPYNVQHPFAMWRVRSSRPGEHFEHTDELSYPPEKHTGLGRMNYAGSPIFYGASSPETAMAECRLRLGDRFHLTKYVIKSDSKLYANVVGNIDHVRRRSTTFLDRQLFQLAIEYVLGKLHNEVALAVQLVDAFIADHLGRKGSEDHYRVSAEIANELLRPKEIQGLFYPSVEHAGGINYAFKPAAFDADIVPIETRACAVLKAYGYGAYKVSQSKPAEITEVPGPISWPA